MKRVCTDGRALGLYYDVSVFQVNVKDRIESEQLTQTETIDVNTGNTRSRGVELEGHYDLLRLFSTIASNVHLDAFANASLLDARFTSSIVPGQTGKIPAYAPHGVFKAGLTARQDDRYKISLVVDTVGSQYFQDSDRSHGFHARPYSDLHRGRSGGRLCDRRTF